MNRVANHTLFETRVILATWSVFCGWVLFVCAGAYQGAEDGAASDLSFEAPVPTVMGLPSWVFWGIAIPWLTATLVTIVFALRGIERDDEPIAFSSHIPTSPGDRPDTDEDRDA